VLRNPVVGRLFSILIHRLTCKTSVKNLKIRVFSYFKIIFTSLVHYTYGHHQVLRKLLCKTAALLPMNTIPKYILVHRRRDDEVSIN
jgi:hypothetical protein